MHGQIAEALANLTMFQKKCFDDVISMTAKRSDVESELRDRQARILEQESGLRFLRTQYVDM